MLVVMRDITTIKLYPQNPRHNDHAVDAVAASLREFGFRRPIVVDDDGVIVVGGTRYKATVPCVIIGFQAGRSGVFQLSVAAAREDGLRYVGQLTRGFTASQAGGRHRIFD
jgi:hypothetical protein